MGRDIWRFKLPPLSQDPYQKETELCLTGNYIFDVNEPLLEQNNLQTGGTYVYSRVPDGIADISPANEPISLADGKLTNRLAAYESRQRFDVRNRNFAQITPQWIVSWLDAAPITITFDLKNDQPLAKCRLFYSGTVPSLTVMGSHDGHTWEKLVAASEETAGKDVKDLVAPLSGTYRYIKLDFGKRQAGDVFELCEVEIWGPPVR